MNAFRKTRIRTPVYDQLCGVLPRGKRVTRKGLADDEPPGREVWLLQDCHQLSSTVGPQRGVERQVMSWYQLIEHMTE